MKTNEVIQAVCRELAPYGIRPVMYNGGKHIRMEWQANNRLRVFNAPCTPSDVRARLNARADVRRMIRDDKLEPITKPREVKHPMLHPEASERLARVEQELAACIDLLMELQTPKVIITINGKSMELVEIPPAPGRHTVADRVLDALSFTDTMSCPELASKLGKPKANISTTLTSLAKAGRVERLGRGQWRKKQIK